MGRGYSTPSPAPTLVASWTLAMCCLRTEHHGCFRSVHGVLLRKGEQRRPAMLMTIFVSGLIVPENMAIMILLSIMFYVINYVTNYFNATKNVFSCITTRRWRWTSGLTWLASVPAGLRTKLSGRLSCWAVSQTLVPSPP